MTSPAWLAESTPPCTTPFNAAAWPPSWWFVHVSRRGWRRDVVVVRPSETPYVWSGGPSGLSWLLVLLVLSQALSSPYPTLHVKTPPSPASTLSERPPGHSWTTGSADPGPSAQPRRAGRRSPVTAQGPAPARESVPAQACLAWEDIVCLPYVVKTSADKVWTESLRHTSILTTCKLLNLLWIVFEFWTCQDIRVDSHTWSLPESILHSNPDFVSSNMYEIF